MGVISPGFVLIYWNQMALCLLDWNRELSSPSEAWTHPLRMSSVARLIRLVNHHFNNLPDRAHRVVNVYSWVIYLEKGSWKKGTKSSMFHLYRFMNFLTAEEFFTCKPSQLRRGLLRAQSCLWAACLVHPQSPSHADFFCLIIVHFLWIFDISFSWPCQTVAILPPFFIYSQILLLVLLHFLFCGSMHFKYNSLLRISASAAWKVKYYQC